MFDNGLNNTRSKEYAFRIFPYTNNDGSTDWICEYPDLPGCSGVGDTPEEAIESGEESKRLWLEANDLPDIPTL